MSFIEPLQAVDLSKNEALIYETLVDFGELGVSDIARESKVNRRNVYDTLNRLQEKGLVFEIKKAREGKFKAVHPSKLREILKERENKLESIIPELERMYRETPREEEVYIYRGIEGWKNVFSLFLEVRENLYTIAGKGALQDDKISHFIQNFFSQLENKGFMQQVLFDHEVCQEEDMLEEVFSHSEYRFLPQDFSTSSVIDVCGDYTVIFSDLSSGKIDANSSFTVIKNPPIADSFRTWFQFMWDSVDK